MSKSLNFKKIKWHTHLFSLYCRVLLVKFDITPTLRPFCRSRSPVSFWSRSRRHTHPTRGSDELPRRPFRRAIYSAAAQAHHCSGGDVRHTHAPVGHGSSPRCAHGSTVVNPDIRCVRTRKYFQSHIFFVVCAPHSFGGNRFSNSSHVSVLS